MENILNWFKINLLKVQVSFDSWFLAKIMSQTKKWKLVLCQCGESDEFFFLIRDYNWWKKLQEACIHFMEKGNVQNYDEL